MADITASMVKELREKTGAGMMDAKNALTENGGNMDAAVDWLRSKGLAKAAKKSGRTAAEGLVAVITSGTKGAVVEINSETDFVARNEEFQAFVKKVAEVALNTPADADLGVQAFEGGKTVQGALTDLIAKIGENMSLRRFRKLEVESGAVIAYVHSALADNLGKIGVLVALQSSAPAASLQGPGKQLAMHVAAANPEFLNIANVDTAALDRERSVLSEQARESGKDEAIIAKMVEGRLRKFYEEVCLMEQIFIMDGETKITKFLENAGKEVGGAITIKDYARFQLGEGIEKEETDFAAEVAKVANG
jgi:elongation factor Ts